MSESEQNQSSPKLLTLDHSDTPDVTTIALQLDAHAANVKAMIERGQVAPKQVIDYTSLTPCSAEDRPTLKAYYAELKIAMTEAREKAQLRARLLIALSSHTKMRYEKNVSEQREYIKLAGLDDSFLDLATGAQRPKLSRATYDMARNMAARTDDARIRAMCSHILDCDDARVYEVQDLAGVDSGTWLWHGSAGQGATKMHVIKARTPVTGAKFSLSSNPADWRLEPRDEEAQSPKRTTVLLDSESKVISSDTLPLLAYDTEVDPRGLFNDLKMKTYAEGKNSDGSRKYKGPKRAERKSKAKIKRKAQKQQRK